MASQNIHDIFLANPITSNTSTDLMYFGQSPYGASNDAAMTFANFAAQFPTKANIQNQAFTYAVSSGSANAIAITLTPALGAYADGQIVSFRSGSNNTGATTLTEGALAAKQLLVAGANACVGGEIQGGTPYLAQYSSAAGAYFLLNPSMFPPSSLQAGNLPTNVQLQINSFNSGTGASSSTFWRGDGTWASASGSFNPVNIQSQAYTYGFDSGTTNAYVISLSPAFTTPADGALFYFRTFNSNTGACTIDVGFGPTNLVNQDRSALSAGAILGIGGIYGVAYNATDANFVLLNSSAVSGPWQSGAGTASAIGGSSTTAAGNNALAFGTSCQADEQSDFAFGTTVVVTSNTVGHNFGFGNSVTINSSNGYNFVFGNNLLMQTGTSSFLFGNTSFGSPFQGNYCFIFGNALDNASPTGDYCFVFGNNPSSISGNAGVWSISDSNPNAANGNFSDQFNATFANGYNFYLNGTPTLAVGIDSTGQVTIAQPGTGLTIKSGANCKIGTATLVGGTVTVANTSITASSLILLTVQVAGGVQGNLSIGTVTAGTSFIINSTNIADTSTVGYMIVERI